MIETKMKISSKQLFLFLLSTQCGLGILKLPANLAHYAGHDGWISVLLAIIPSSVAIIVIISLSKRYEDKSLFVINKLLFGKVLGIILNMIFMVYCLMISAITLRIFCELVYIAGFEKTPPLFIASISLIPSMILLNGGLQAICRFANIIILIIVITTIYCCLNINRIDLLNLMPVGSVGLSRIFNGMIISSYACLGIELLPIAYIHVTDKTKVMSSVLLANLINLLFILLIVFISTSIFGEKMIIHLEIPLFNLFGVYYSDIIERTDAFFIILWFIALMCVFRTYLYVVFHGLNKQHKVNHSSILLVVIFIITIALSRVPKSFNDVYNYLFTFDKFGVGIILFLMFCYLFSFVNKKGILNKGDRE